MLTCREQTERAANRLKWPASSRNRGRFQIGMVAGWERGRLLHATLQIIQSEERNLSRDRTAAAIHALDRCKTVTFKTAFYSLDLEQANAGDLAAKASKARALM